jgi:Icc protein
VTNARTALFILAVVCSCVSVATGRAERDLDVGRAEQGGMRVEVNEGLAAIRSFAPGELRLWAQAPVLTIRMSLGNDGGGPWSITVENSLPDAVLRAEGPGGEPLEVTLAEAPVPTEKRWAVDLPAGADVVLTLSPPDADVLEPWRFAAFADVQERLDDVQDIYTRMNEDASIRFALISGDLTSQGTEEQLARFQREQKTLNFPCYATLGNHELGTREDLFHDYFGRGNFSFGFRGAQFTLLDSASATIDPLVYEWLGGWLAQGRDKPHVVVMHIPPIDPVGTRNGSFASRAEANKLITMMADEGVDLTIYGHIHSYYAFSNAGIPAHITGGGGAIPERLDGIGRHFLTIDVEPPGKITQVAVVRVD